MKYKFIIAIAISILVALINFNPIFSFLWNSKIGNINIGLLIWIFSPLFLFIILSFIISKDDSTHHKTQRS